MTQRMEILKVKTLKTKKTKYYFRNNGYLYNIYGTWSGETFAFNCSWEVIPFEKAPKYVQKEYKRFNEN